MTNARVANKAELGIMYQHNQYVQDTIIFYIITILFMIFLGKSYFVYKTTQGLNNLEDEEEQEDITDLNQLSQLGIATPDTNRISMMRNTIRG